MTEGEARDWIGERFGKARCERLDAFLTMVAAENAHQNLVAPSTVSRLWVRHALDSAQLLRWDRPGLWLDIGSGGGFPGLVVALLRECPMLLVEPRKRRAEFLARCASALMLDHVEVRAVKVQVLRERAVVISARAVASIENLLQIGARCAKENTRWVLPRGHLSEEDRAMLERRWRGTFHVEQSITDSDSAILILDGANA